MSAARASISVVIPVCNGKHYLGLGLAIDSMVAQTHRPAAILVIDDRWKWRDEVARFLWWPRTAEHVSVRDPPLL